MGIRKQALIWAGILAGLFLLLDTGFAAPKDNVLTTVTTGSRQIAGEDISGARQAAVSAALEQALVNAVAQVVSPQVFAANLAFLYDRILPSAQEYVVLFKVLGEATHKNRYLVGVESRINLAMLEQTLTDAGIINVDTGRPAVLLLIAEQISGDVLPRYWWGNNPAQYLSHAEARIAQILEQNRFKMVGMGQERPVPASYDIRFPSIYDKASAMDLAERLNADLVVIGRAGATESINRMGDEKIFDAVIHLEALDVKARQPLTEVEHRAGARSDATGPGDVQALIQAADLAAADMVEKLDRFWAQSLRKETRFDVQIEGNGFLPRFIALKKRFAEMREIENIQQKEVGSDHAVMEVIYKGSPSHFADSIMRTSFDGFGIDIVEVTDSVVKIRFIDGAGG